MEHENFPLPFRRNEDPDHRGEYLTTFESSIDPNFVVKELKEPEPRRRAELDLAGMKAFYQELRFLFGDQIPQTIFTLIDVREDPKQGIMSNIKIVQDKISGNIPSRDLLEKHAEYKKALIEFFEKSLDYYLKSYDKKIGRGRLIDTSVGNFIIGHSNFDPTDKVYFIDSQHSIVPGRIGNSIKFLMEDLNDLNITSPKIEHSLEKMLEMKRKFEK